MDTELNGRHRKMQGIFIRANVPKKIKFQAASKEEIRVIMSLPKEYL